MEYVGYSILVVQCDDYISGRKRRHAYQEFIPRRQFSKIQNQKSKSSANQSHRHKMDKTLVTSTAIQKYSAAPRKRFINQMSNSISTINDFEMINEPRERSFRVRLQSHDFYLLIGYIDVGDGRCGQRSLT